MNGIAVIKIFKAYGGRVTDGQWVNTYHVAVTEDTPIEDPAWLNLVNAIKEFERNIHVEAVNFMHATLSTLKTEPEYDPATLRVFELAGIGGRGNGGGGTPVALDVALKVRKVVGYGRTGNLFYRGALNTTEVSSAAGGRMSLVGGGPLEIQNACNAFVTGLADELSAVSGSLVMPPPGAATATGPIVNRIVLSLAVSGLSLNRHNHAWFNRKPKASGPTAEQLAGDDDGDGVENANDPDSEFYQPSTD